MNKINDNLYTFEGQQDIVSPQLVYYPAIIRENIRKMPEKQAREIIDISINQTLARTMVTSLTTMLAVVALLFFGGSTLFGFAAAMIFGIIFGTYSSIFVASALVDRMGVTHEDLLPRAKKQVDELP